MLFQHTVQFVKGAFLFFFVTVLLPISQYCMLSYCVQRKRFSLASEGDNVQFINCQLAFSTFFAREKICKKSTSESTIKLRFEVQMMLLSILLKFSSDWLTFLVFCYTMVTKKYIYLSSLLTPMLTNVTQDFVFHLFKN